MTRQEILDAAYRRAYAAYYGQAWDTGTPRGHEQAREIVTTHDVATVAAAETARLGMVIRLLDATLDAIIETTTLVGAHALANAATDRPDHRPTTTNPVLGHTADHDQGDTRP